MESTEPTISKLASIEEAIHRLLLKRSFYSYMVSGISRREVPKSLCPTMAVCCNPDTHLGVELIYCKEFIESIDDMEFFEFVIEHEMVHLLLEHIQRFWTDKRLKNFTREAFNVAADLADNSVISKHYSRKVQDKVTNEFLMPSKFEFPDGKSMEIYCLMLKNKQDPEDKGSLVSNHFWDKKLVKDEDGNYSLEEITDKDTTKSSVNQEVNLPDFVQKCVESYSKEQGSLPGFVESLVSGFVKLKESINWLDVMYSTLKTGLPSVRKRSIMRPNRRLWGVNSPMSKFPGKTTDRAYKISMIIDTSASMSNRDLEAAFAVLKNLMNFSEDIEVYVSHADTEIKNTVKISSREDFDLKVYGRGGTDFVKPLQEIEETVDPDIILYFTDGYGIAPEEPPKAQLIWFLTYEHCTNPTERHKEPYGKVIHVKY